MWLLTVVSLTNRRPASSALDSPVASSLSTSSSRPVSEASAGGGLSSRGSVGANATLAVGASDTLSGSGQLRIDRLPLRRTGPAERSRWSPARGCMLIGDASAGGTPTTSDLQADTTISDPFTPTGSTNTPTKGIVQVASGSVLKLIGKTTLQRGAILQLDDSTDGTKSKLIGEEGTAPRLSGAVATDGTFQWRSGTVVGPITMDKVGTDVGAVGTTTRRYLETNDDDAAAAITFAGPVAVNATMVTLKPKARVSVTSAMVIASVGSGFERSSATLDGQKLVISTGGSMRRDLPGDHTRWQLHQLGRDHDQRAGRQPRNRHARHLAERACRLHPGHPRRRPGHAGAGHRPPRFDRHPEHRGRGGNFGPIELKKGGLGGEGTIATTQLSLGSTWVHPGFGDRAGKLTVQGVLKLSPTSDVQLVMRPAVPAQPTATPPVPAKPITYDVLDVVPLVYTPGDPRGTTSAGQGARADDLAGKVTGVSASGFNPAYGTTMTNLVKFASSTGSFANASWRGTPSGLGWKPAYDAVDQRISDGLAVDLKLVDVAAPALGLASIASLHPVHVAARSPTRRSTTGPASSPTTCGGSAAARPGVRRLGLPVVVAGDDGHRPDADRAWSRATPTASRSGSATRPATSAPGASRCAPRGCPTTAASRRPRAGPRPSGKAGFYGRPTAAARRTAPS